MPPQAEGATGLVDRAGKFDESTITRGLDDTPTMLRYLGIDQFAATSLERCESTLLVITHQAAVADNIGCQNGR